ncbi:RagB/SusD family nutrient uptake outer membrane protein [Arenibacter palladensis]|uniref:RagB/SusD family nutrient uptake outer membrane protein n=1 Tax=Arenibacter palladensis TaxID=237373 RepID=UPI002FCFC9C1
MKTKIYLISTIFIVLLSACEDDFLEKTPLDGPADVNFLQNEEELSLAINGVYENLWFHDISATGQWEYILDTTTDTSWDRNGSIFTNIGNGSHSSTDNDFATIWGHLYTGIARCNYILENLDRVSDVSQNVLDQSEGQVRFLRAYWYSQLTSLWGDVPLVTSIQGLENNNTPKSSKSEVIEFILSDLEIAAQKLPETWSDRDTGRATRNAAIALQSRVALIANDYEKVISAASQIINSSQYELYPDYRGLFQYEGESNSEVIFEVMFQYAVHDHRMPVSVGSRNSRANSTKVPTQAMVDSYECTDGLTIDESPLYDPAKPFENRDPRLKQSIATPGDIFLGYQFETHRDSVECWNFNVTPPERIPNQDALNAFASFSGYCWKKMADSQDYPDFRNNSSLNFILIRYSEILLNYAEAKIELNQIDQSCLDAINSIRGRESVQMPAIVTGLSQAEMRKIIRRERKIELAMEGLRLQDIRRWGIADKALSGELYGRPNKPYSYGDQGVPVFDEDGFPNYSAYSDKLRVIEVRSFNASRDYLWPIPQSEIDINANLEQNPGY